MSTEVYFIRPTADVLRKDVAAPRTLDTLRRSLDGELCIVAFVNGNVPEGWEDGMTAEECMAIINAPDAMGIWRQPE